MIFDAHCDVLYQLQNDGTKDFQNGDDLHITYQQLVDTGAKIQCFAIFLSPRVKSHNRFDTALEMVDLFYEKILKPNPRIKLVRSKHDIDNLKDNEMGAVLTLEGCESIEENLVKLRALYRLGLRSVGLTWNYANAAADGALEKRGGGLTYFGQSMIKELNKLKIWTDVSHLSEKAFWDTIELAEYPIASHSNCYRICKHPRNLKDDQIKALIQKNGVIGITFVPEFVKENGQTQISDVIRHIDHICSLGGEHHLGFGSDFDGTEKTIPRLSRYKDYEILIESLLKYYSARQVKNFLFDNFVSRFPQ
ncbi:dipeptidase [Bacillus smithii]|uniref:dipeptidase n=1 Tax=Bacillus smithii TaxID=1479 RepID=UPI0030C9EE60